MRGFSHLGLFFFFFGPYSGKDLDRFGNFINDRRKGLFSVLKSRPIRPGAIWFPAIVAKVFATIGLILFHVISLWVYALARWDFDESFVMSIEDKIGEGFLSFTKWV